MCVRNPVVCDRYLDLPETRHGVSRVTVRNRRGGVQIEGVGTRNSLDTIDPPAV